MTETVLELTQEMKEELAPPCETPDNGCSSQYSQPAEWIFSHPNNTGGCSILLCTPCKEHEEAFFKRMAILEGFFKSVHVDKIYECFHCHQEFNAKDMIIRRM